MGRPVSRWWFMRWLTESNVRSLVRTCEKKSNEKCHTYLQTLFTQLGVKVIIYVVHRIQQAVSNLWIPIFTNWSIRASFTRLSWFLVHFFHEKQSDWLKIQDSKLVVGSGEQDNGLTIPSGSTRSKCFFKLFCSPVSTYWPGFAGDSRTRKSPS